MQADVKIGQVTKDLILVLVQTVRLHPLLTDVPLLRFGHILYVTQDINHTLVFPKVSLVIIM